MAHRGIFSKGLVRPELRVWRGAGGGEGNTRGKPPRCPLSSPCNQQAEAAAGRAEPASFLCLLYSTHHEPSLSVPDNLGYSEERRKRPPQLLFPITASQHGITRVLHKLKHALPAARGRTASNAVRKVERSSESVHLGSRWGAGERGQQRDPRAVRGGGLEPLQPALPLLREGSEVSLSAPALPTGEPAPSRHHRWAQMLRKTDPREVGYPEAEDPPGGFA